MSPPLLTPAAYVAAWLAAASAGLPPGGAPEVRGLYGRILKGRSEADFARLSHDRDRRLVLLMDGEGLGQLLGLDADAALARIGYRPDYVQALRAQGQRFRLLVCAAHPDVVPATWANVVALAGREFPEAAGRLRAAQAELAAADFTTWRTRAGEWAALRGVAPYPWHEVRDQGRAHPRFMTAARYLAGEDAPWRARALLYCELRLTDLFAGDGFTRQPDGSPGLAEYLAPNLEVGALGEVATVDLQ